MNQTFLDVQHIYKTYDAVNALQDINLQIITGEIHCIVGENGCGKSTLMKIISGVIPPDPRDESSISIHGKKHAKYLPAIAMHEGIQIIYQDLSLFPNLTIAENIITNNRISGQKAFVNYKEMHNYAKEMLAKVQLNVDPDELVENLSIAGQQLVAIARAMTSNLKLLIMDEPTASLGKSDVDHLIQIITSLKSSGVSIIFIGHKLDEVMKIADRITVIRDGRIIETLTNVSKVSEKQLATLMTGKEEINYDLYIKNTHKTEKPLLEIKNFSKAHQFEKIDLQVFKGEILGIIGLVGAGRTELMTSIFGLNTPDQGEIYIDSKPTSIKTVNDAIKNGIVLVPENRLIEGLFVKKSIKQNINVTTLDTQKNSLGFLNSLKLNAHSTSWINALKIKTKNHNNSVTSLSGGNQQRIVLSKWLATKPKILILDGPTIGIDIGAKAEIHQLIRNLVTEENLTVIMITDEITEVLQNSSRIIVMRDGKFVLNKDRNEVDEPQIRTALGIE